ncbi:MAG TPA: hypothetical protein VG889_02345 [Rhizomicrobium sp.]|nr:hypothetical protein [Rhizomicrobium sp.]
MANSDSADTNDERRIRDATDALLRILDANKFERFTYLGISVISFAAVLYLVVRQAQSPNVDLSALVVTLGPTGVVGLCVARVLKVWSDCTDLLKAVLLGLKK